MIWLLQPLVQHPMNSKDVGLDLEDQLPQLRPVPPWQATSSRRRASVISVRSPPPATQLGCPRSMATPSPLVSAENPATSGRSGTPRFADVRGERFDDDKLERFGRPAGLVRRVPDDHFSIVLACLHRVESRRCSLSARGAMLGCDGAATGSQPPRAVRRTVSTVLGGCRVCGEVFHGTR